MAAPLTTTQATIAPISTRPPLPKTFTYTTPAPTLHYQGAEALLYRTHFLSYPSPNITDPSDTTIPNNGNSTTIPTLPAALKHRPPKPYRHPLLDAKLTRHRILSEARVLAKLRREGIAVPALYAFDWEQGWMLMEWIDGRSVRACLDSELGAWLRDVAEGRDEEAVRGSSLWRIMRDTGALVGAMHKVGVVHGDLTTSNLLLRQSSIGDEAGAAIAAQNEEVVLIDFGLAGTSSDVEDRAVDLYVLERAFGSTHPGTEKLFGEVLRAYGESYKGAKQTLKRYEDVRMRGRKKIVLG